MSEQDIWEPLDGRFVKFDEPGECWVGEYKGTFRGERFDNLLVDLILDDGDRVFLPGVSMLARQLERVPIGSRVKVVFLGREQIPGRTGRSQSDFYARVKVSVAKGTALVEPTPESDQEVF